MIRDISDTIAAGSFLLMGVIFVLRAASWPMRIAYAVGTVAGLAVPWALARRALRRQRLRELLADLALYDRRPEPNEDVPTFLARLEGETARPLGWQLRSPIETERARCVRALLRNYRQGKPS